MTRRRTAPAGTQLGWNATFSMAVGGMIGGGIFSVLGVVVELAGRWAWVSFVVGGAIALATAYSYVQLARSVGEGGGAFTFLRRAGHGRLAGLTSWVLIVGYVLTTSVYAFTFGHYVSHVVGGGAVLARGLAVAVMAGLVAVNLGGVGGASALEVVTVWGKLVVLGGLAAIGVSRWEPAQLDAGGTGGAAGVVIGAAAVFMAYEGFQLLTYDYDDIRDPDRTLPRAVLAAVVTVIAVYVAVALGAAMLVGGSTLVEQREVALAAAGEEAAGTVGTLLVSVAAAFSAASAINATLFATARLSRIVADDHELPQVLAHRSRRGVPDRAVVVLGGAGTALAALGSLTALVEAASLMFLVTFTAVNSIAARRRVPLARICWAGAAGAASASAVATVRLAVTRPLALAALVALVLAAAIGRSLLHRAAG